MKTLAERFWAKVERRGPDECWLWTGAKQRGGYGHLSRGPRGGGFISAPQAAWTLTYNGPFLPKSHFRHICDNPPCCNPTHIVPGTSKDNVADAVSRGRHAHGASSGTARLTEGDILVIRAMRGMDQRKLAAHLGISQQHVSDLQTGKRWRHIQ